MAAKQRVNGIIVKLLYKLFTLFGYKFVYYSLYIVVAYYFFFAKNVKKSLQIYYRQIDKPFNSKVYFNHLFKYAITMTDRFISKTHPHLYLFENFDRQMNKKVMTQGVIMVSTHFGGWAAATNYFRYEETKVHVVMNESMLAQTQEFYKSLDKTNEEIVEVIDLSKGMQSSIEIANALLNNECVAMMADRAYRKKDLMSKKFFNKDAYLNKNPFQIAYKADKEILAYLFIFEDINKYNTVSKKIIVDKSLSEEAAVSSAMDEYVSFLEYYLKLYPDQWFNFYDFWSSDGIEY